MFFFSFHSLFFCFRNFFSFIFIWSSVIAETSARRHTPVLFTDKRNLFFFSSVRWTFNSIFFLPFSKYKLSCFFSFAICVFLLYFVFILLTSHKFSQFLFPDKHTHTSIVHIYIRKVRLLKFVIRCFDSCIRVGF